MTSVTVNKAGLLKAAHTLSTTAIAGAVDSNGNPVYLTAAQLLDSLAALGAGTKGKYDQTAINSYVTQLKNGSSQPGATILTNDPAEIKPYLSTVAAALTSIGIKTKASGGQNTDTDVENPAGSTGSVQQGLHLNVGLPSWTHELSKFLGDLMQGETWIRAAEVVGGAAVLFIAIDKGFSGGKGITKLAQSGVLM
jgi:hypothetical protein